MEKAMEIVTVGIGHEWVDDHTFEKHPVFTFVQKKSLLSSLQLQVNSLFYYENIVQGGPIPAFPALSSGGYPRLDECSKNPYASV